MREEETQQCSQCGDEFGDIENWLNIDNKALCIDCEKEYEELK